MTKEEVEEIIESHLIEMQSHIDEEIQGILGEIEEVKNELSDLKEEIAKKEQDDDEHGCYLEDKISEIENRLNNVRIRF
jgi:peptidoglycan hydrolase CwlO-like protein